MPRRKEAENAWVVSRRLDDVTCRGMIDEWKQRFDEIDMHYGSGSAPPGLSGLLSGYTNAAERLGQLARELEDSQPLSSD